MAQLAETLGSGTSPRMRAAYLAANASATSGTIDFPLGDDRANGVIAALNGTGSLSGFFGAAPGKTAEPIFDVTGYFVPCLATR